MSGGGNAKKFLVLAWKTLIVKGRHYVETILDLIVPSLLFIVLVVLRYQFDGFQPTTEDPVLGKNLEMFENFCDGFSLDSYIYAHHVILYAPNVEATNATAEQMKRTVEYMRHQYCRESSPMGKLLN